jgi:hypothetical protein
MAPAPPFDVPSDQLTRCCTALKQQLGISPYGPIRHLVCRIDRDRITVQGTVPTFYLRQIAQSVAAQVAGIECVCSEIGVESDLPASRESDR